MLRNFSHLCFGESNKILFGFCKLLGPPQNRISVKYRAKSINQIKSTLFCDCGSHRVLYMSPPVPQAEPRWPFPSRPLPLRSLSTSHTECLHQQSVSPHRLRKLACACHSHNGRGINTFVPILAALPLCPPAPKNRTACKTQPLCQLITALLLQSFAASFGCASATQPEIFTQRSAGCPQPVPLRGYASRQVDQREASSSLRRCKNEITPPRQEGEMLGGVLPLEDLHSRLQDNSGEPFASSKAAL